MNNPRIAWVMPIACVYWQVILREFVKAYPQTKIFTSKKHESPKGLENTLDIEVVGKLKVIQFKPRYGQYSSKFAYMSLAIVNRLLKYQPQIIFADTFSLWTLLVSLTKPLGKWKIILAYEGSSPGVDYCYSPLRLLVRRIIINMADAYITNSQVGKNYLIKILYAPANRVFAYPYLVPDSQFLLKHPEAISLPPLTTLYRQKIEIDTGRYKFSENNLLGKKPVFLFVGRLIPRKGIKFLLEACTILNQKGYNNRYSLMIIGEGQQRAELEQFCQNNQLNDYANWIGQVNYQNISTYFRQADVLVLPCIEDTWGMVVLEAILFGKAVLCSTGAGASEIIAQEKNGYVFEPQNAQKLAQLMANLIDNPHLITTMKKKSALIAPKITPETATNFLIKTVKLLG
ncbi:Glycosyl transferase group 1 [Hyella patelloides LEGE 07179]|uniref:Glycosyl transferase group 1 n=1 Tax=Hyella patelloides LEGE 07179 TaxID=945734 RepID=A0A563VMQ2_9CYAN|nr:glycosyltransferase family 4 protein [Hyella patelloides]VEP12692.1 Glycosyl transferase group 1 [Hyella patelloides LEGE 07179]